MTLEMQGAIDRQLEALEHKGRRHLTVAARRNARQVGWTTAAAATIAMPLAVWLLIELHHSGIAALAAAVTAIPLAGFAIGYASARRRRAVERDAALALFDHRLGMNDRVRIADEFGGLRDRNGFQEAAVREAQPWLAQALNMTIGDAGEGAAARPQRWPFVVAAVALTLTVIGFGGREPEAASPGASPLRRALATIGIGAGRPDPRKPADRSSAAGPAARAGGAGQGGGGGRADIAQGARRGGQGDAARRTGAAGDPGAPASPSSQAGGAAGSSDPVAAAAGKQARARDADASPAAASPATAERGSAGSADAEGGAGKTPAAPGSPARRPEPSAAAAAAPPAGGTPPPPRPPSDNRSGSRPNSPNRQQGQQASQSNGQGSGRSGQQGAGRGFGQDALKRARGTSALLLAVPMEDRVIGTVNAGRVTSVTRPSLPRAVPVGAVAAQARDGRGGDAGRIVHRATTVQEDRLLGRFFQRGASARRPATGGQGE